MKTRAALAVKAGAPLEIVEIDLDAPRANEVLVEVKATGVCHTDAFTLSGKDPEEIEVKFTGLRPGEKLFEELITAGEDVLETGHEKIMVLRPNQGSPIPEDALEALLAASRRFESNAVRDELARLVPEYAPPEGVCPGTVCVGR